MKNKVLFIVFALLFSDICLAQYRGGYGRGSRSSSGASAFYLEPYTGYFKGDLTGTNLKNRGLTGSVKSFIAGTRMGYISQMGLITGVDFAFGKSGSIDTDTPSVKRIDYEPLDLGAFIGYQMNDYIRIWGSYIFDHKVTLDGIDATSTALEDFEGNGYNAGISIKGLPSIRINLEYHVRKIEKLNGNSFSASDNESKTFLLSLALPFEFPMGRITGR